jgi:hypothetical protein
MYKTKWVMKVVEMVQIPEGLFTMAARTATG